MKTEFFDQQREINLPRQIEIPLNSEDGLARLENWLKEIISEDEAEQCVFVLRSMVDMDFVNQCQEATGEFGKRLTEQFGEEESFFEISPSTNFSDVRSRYRLSKTNYRGDYHSVGLLEFNPKNKETFSLIFDLTYGNVAGEGKRKDIFVIYSPGKREQAAGVLKNKYGGSWETAMELNKKTGKLVFPEDNKKLSV